MMLDSDNALHVLLKQNIIPWGFWFYKKLSLTVESYHTSTSKCLAFHGCLADGFHFVMPTFVCRSELDNQCKY